MEVLRQNSGSKLRICHTHHLGAESLFKRVPGETPHGLSEAAALVVGCGSVGSRIAETLIKAGLGRLVLADNDELRVGNVCRHVLGLDYLGKNKADALRDHLLKRNPFADIEALNKNMVSETTLLSLATSKVNLVISCIGKDAVEILISDCAMLLSKPVLFCRTYAHGTIGEILLGRAGKCCFGCASGYLNRDDCTVPRPPPIEFQNTVDFDTDCGATFIPASAVDLDLISLHCARLAIALLTGENIVEDYWMVRGRPFTASENWKVDDRLKPPFSLLEYSFENDLSCEVCGRKAHESDPQTESGQIN